MNKVFIILVVLFLPSFSSATIYYKPLSGTYQGQCKVLADQLIATGTYTSSIYITTVGSSQSYNNFTTSIRSALPSSTRHIITMTGTGVTLHWNGGDYLYLQPGESLDNFMLKGHPIEATDQLFFATSECLPDCTQDDIDLADSNCPNSAGASYCDAGDLITVCDFNDCQDLINDCFARCNDGNEGRWECNDTENGPEQPLGPCVCLDDISALPVYQYNELTGELTFNNSVIPDNGTQPEQAQVSNLASINENLEKSNIQNIQNHTETITTITETTQAITNLDQTTQNTTTAITNLNQTTQDSSLAIVNKLDELKNYGAPDQSDTTAIEEGIVDEITNAGDLVLDGKTQEISDSIDDIINDNPMSGGESFFDGILNTISVMIPHETECEPYTFIIPTTEIEFSIGCESSAKTKQFLGWLLTFYTLFTVYELLINKITPKKN